jgi:hypothetical protein
MTSKELSNFRNEVMQSLHTAIDDYLKGKITKEQMMKKYDNLFITGLKRAHEAGVSFALKHHHLEFAKGFNAGLEYAKEEIKKLPDVNGINRYVHHKIDKDNSIYLKKDHIEIFLNELKM